MTQQPKSNDLLDPFGTFRSVRDASLETWSKIMIDIVNSDAYAETTAKWLDTYLTISQPFQRIIETTMTRTLASLNMPARSDVSSLAERLTNIELRLDDLDAKLDDIQHALQQIPGRSAATSASTEEQH